MWELQGALKSQALAFSLFTSTRNVSKTTLLALATMTRLLCICIVVIMGLKALSDIGRIAESTREFQSFSVSMSAF